MSKNCNFRKQTHTDFHSKIGQKSYYDPILIPLFLHFIINPPPLLCIPLLPPNHRRRITEIATPRPSGWLAIESLASAFRAFLRDINLTLFVSHVLISHNSVLNKPNRQTVVLPNSVIVDAIIALKIRLIFDIYTDNHSIEVHYECKWMRMRWHPPNNSRFSSWPVLDFLRSMQ